MQRRMHCCCMQLKYNEKGIGSTALKGEQCISQACIHASFWRPISYKRCPLWIELFKSFQAEDNKFMQIQSNATCYKVVTRSPQCMINFICFLGRYWVNLYMFKMPTQTHPNDKGCVQMLSIFAPNVDPTLAAVYVLINNIYNIYTIFSSFKVL